MKTDPTDGTRACSFNPRTDNINTLLIHGEFLFLRVENTLQKSQLNLQTPTADTEAVPSNGKAASEQLSRTVVEQEVQQDVSESNIQYKGNLEYLESKMNWLKRRLNGLEEIVKAFLEKKSEMRALIGPAGLAAGRVAGA